MVVTAKIDKASMNALKKRLRTAQKRSVAYANKMTKRMSIVFIRAAAKRTKPGKTFKVSKLAKKDKTRPVVSNPLKKQRMRGEFWYENLDNGKIFKLGHELSIGSQRQTTIVPVTRAIKIFDKKRRRFVFVGTTLSRGLHAGKKATKIPGAGAGKAGWIGGLRKLGKTADTGKITNKVNTTIVKGGKDPFVFIHNHVDYVAKTSPRVVNDALKTTENYFAAIERKKFERMKTK